MDTHERIEKEREARRLASARRSRAGFLRGRVIAVSILCFGVLWTVVFVQMATGNDPVLSAKAQPGTTTRASERRGSVTHRPATEAVEPEPAEPEVVEEPRVEFEEPEVEFEEPEVVEEPEILEEPEVVEEPELEPLTTSQS